jgi:L-alanine-DL-glutamate epimerase-like enolase superfamily enzyme
VPEVVPAVHAGQLFEKHFVVEGVTAHHHSPHGVTREVLGAKLMATDARRGLAEGFGTFYVKLGTGFDRDLEVARALREALGPGPKLRVDANEAWSNGTAMDLMKRMSQYDIEFFEQPLLNSDHDGAAHLRRALGLAVAANQSAWTESDVLEIIKKGAADVVLTDQHQLGSLSRLRHVAWLLATAGGIPVVKHSFGDLGISTAAGMHAIASCPNFTRANQTHFGVLTDDIIEGGLAKFRNGCLTLPEGPGLGVKLDRQRLTKYARYFEEHGELSAYGSGEDMVKRAAQYQPHGPGAMKHGAVEGPTAAGPALRGHPPPRPEGEGVS